MVRRICVSSILLVLFLLMGCGRNQYEVSNQEPAISREEKTEDVWPRSFMDASKRLVSLEKTPERVTLLHTFYLEHFLALDVMPTASALGNSLGQTSPLKESELFAPYLQNTEIMDIGSARTINLEAVLASKPDVIVSFSTHGGLETIYDQLKTIAPVALLDYTASWQEQLRHCAILVGKEAEAEQVIARIEAEIENTRTVLSQVPDKSFVLVRTDGKAFITRSDDNYYKTFGLTKPEFWPSSFSTISLETIASMNPYYIVFQHNTSAAKAFVDSLSNNVVWLSLDAVKNNRVHYFDENMNTFGPLSMELTAKKLVQLFRGL